MVHLELSTLLVQLHDHLLLPLVCTPLSAAIGLGILQLSRLLQIGLEGLHLPTLRLLQLQIHLQK